LFYSSFFIAEYRRRVSNIWSWWRRDLIGYRSGDIELDPLRLTKPRPKLGPGTQPSVFSVTSSPPFREEQAEDLEPVVDTNIIDQAIETWVSQEASQDAILYSPKESVRDKLVRFQQRIAEREREMSEVRDKQPSSVARTQPVAQQLYYNPDRPTEIDYDWEDLLRRVVQLEETTRKKLPGKMSEVGALKENIQVAIEIELDATTARKENV
jgi:hypothetical protein